jgi:hypothetical protein
MLPMLAVRQILAYNFIKVSIRLENEISHEKKRRETNDEHEHLLLTRLNTIVSLF